MAASSRITRPPRRNAPMTIRYRLTNETGLGLTCHWLGSVSLTL
jgi:hypothetical protein